MPTTGVNSVEGSCLEHSERVSVVNYTLVIPSGARLGIVVAYPSLSLAAGWHEPTLKGCYGANSIKHFLIEIRCRNRSHSSNTFVYHAKRRPLQETTVLRERTRTIDR